MFWYDLLLALAVGFLLANLFAFALRRTGPWESYFIFFVVIVLAAWAGGRWIRPAGPRIFNVYWVPFLATGLVVAVLLVAASTPRPRTQQTREAKEARVIAALGTFFWVMVLFLSAAIVAGYLVPPHVL
jgi:hypothetical protein